MGYSYAGGSIKPIPHTPEGMVRDECLAKDRHAGRPPRATVFKGNGLLGGGDGAWRAVVSSDSLLGARHPVALMAV